MIAAPDRLRLQMAARLGRRARWQPAGAQDWAFVTLAPEAAGLIETLARAAGGELQWLPGAGAPVENARVHGVSARGLTRALQRLGLSGHPLRGHADLSASTNYQRSATGWLEMQDRYLETWGAYSVPGAEKLPAIGIAELGAHPNLGGSLWNLGTDVVAIGPTNHELLEAAERLEPLCPGTTPASVLDDVTHASLVASIMMGAWYEFQKKAWGGMALHPGELSFVSAPWVQPDFDCGKADAAPYGPVPAMQAIYNEIRASGGAVAIVNASLGAPAADGQVWYDCHSANSAKPLFSLDYYQNGLLDLHVYQTRRLLPVFASGNDRELGTTSYYAAGFNIVVVGSVDAWPTGTIQDVSHFSSRSRCRTFRRGEIVQWWGVHVLAPGNRVTGAAPGPSFLDACWKQPADELVRSSGNSFSAPVASACLAWIAYRLASTARAELCRAVLFAGCRGYPNDGQKAPVLTRERYRSCGTWKTFQATRGAAGTSNRNEAVFGVVNFDTSTAILDHGTHTTTRFDRLQTFTNRAPVVNPYSECRVTGVTVATLGRGLALNQRFAESGVSSWTRVRHQSIGGLTPNRPHRLVICWNVAPSYSAPVTVKEEDSIDGTKHGTFA